MSLDEEAMALAAVPCAMGPDPPAARVTQLSAHVRRLLDEKAATRDLLIGCRNEIEATHETRDPLACDMCLDAEGAEKKCEAMLLLERLDKAIDGDKGGG